MEKLDIEQGESKMGCKCNFREKMVGDGCEVCNPAKALEYAKEEIERLRGVEKAAQWFADNPDSPASALAHIREALDA